MATGGEGEPAEAYTVSPGAFNPGARSISSDSFAYPGSTPSISANGSSDGIVWLVDKGTSELRAYDAVQLAAAVELNRLGGGGIVFVSADKTLNAAGELLRLHDDYSAALTSPAAPATRKPGNPRKPRNTVFDDRGGPAAGTAG